MSQSKFTASERADKCVLSLEQAIYQTTKRERGLVGDTMAQKIINLLDKHQTIVAALQSEHKLNRITFLMTAKRLEHKNILRIIKSTERGNPAKYLERVA